MTWEHEKTFEAALAQPNHPWRGAALAFEPELRRLREENANLRMMNTSEESRTLRDSLRVMSVNEGQLQLRIAQLETAMQTLRAIVQRVTDVTRNVDMFYNPSDWNENGYRRCNPSGLFLPLDVVQAALRIGDHADTTRDTNETRCAPREPETRTLAEDPAGALLEEAPEDREKS
jgi:hypothetical protein